MKNTKLKALTVAVATALGGASVPQIADADVYEFNWTGTWSRLSPSGSAWSNTSITSGNTFLTPISGTMTFDTVTGMGSATLVPFDFLNGTLPYEATGITFQAVGDGSGGAGALVLANMITNWDGNNNMPVSLVWDANGLFTAINAGLGVGGTVNGQGGAVPAIDGTYVGIGVPGTNAGYINIGPVPLATTEFNTTNVNGCVFQNCTGINPSGELPLITDTAVNTQEFLMGDGIGVGGSPMQSLPFSGQNENINITSLTVTNINPTPTSISRVRSWVGAANTNPGGEAFYVEMSGSQGNWSWSNSNKYWGITNLLQGAYTGSYGGDIMLGLEPLTCPVCPATTEVTTAVVTKDFPVANTVQNIMVFEMGGFNGWASINIGGSTPLITVNGDSVGVAMGAFVKGATVTYSSRSVEVYNTATNMIEIQTGWLQDLIAN